MIQTRVKHSRNDQCSLATTLEYLQHLRGNTPYKTVLVWSGFLLWYRFLIDKYLLLANPSHLVSLHTLGLLPKSGG